MRRSVPESYPVLTISFLIVILTCTSLQVKGQSSSYTITFHKRNVTLGTVFNEIQKKTGLIFGYSNDMLDPFEKISVNYWKVPFEEVLAELLIERGFIWKIKDGRIAITKGKPGKEHLKYLKHTNNYLPDVAMPRDLQELVVPGYNPSTLQLTTASVVPAVRAPELTPQFQLTGNIFNSLQGQVTGLQITMTSGILGTPIDIRIRGKLSLTNSTVPLIIVDGIPVRAQITEGLGSAIWGALASALGYINPADIASVDVLKDADATAIYGSRGANGVIIITTKTGRKGPGKLFVNFRAGVANVSRKYQLLNTPEYLQMRREGFYNDKITLTAQNAPDLLKWDTTRYTDWQKVLIGGTAKFYNMQAAYAGGNDTVQYYIGTNYQKNGTVYPGSFYQEGWGFHGSLFYRAPKCPFRISASWSYFNIHSFLPGNDFINYIFLPPNTPPVRIDGELNFSFVNPMVGLVGPLFTANVYNRFGNITAQYQLRKGLEAKLLLGDQLLKGNSQTILPIGMIAPALRAGTSGSVTLYTYRAGSTIIEPQIAYTDTLGKLKLNMMIGGTYNGASESRMKLVASGFKDDGNYSNLAFADSIVAKNNKSLDRYLAFYGRAGLNLQEKYLLNLSIRRDGNSQFGPKKRYGTFWGIGAGWIFRDQSPEDSIKQVLSFGKLRMSFGTSGSDQVGEQQYMDAYSPVTSYQGGDGLTPTSLPNQYLAREKTKKLEVALDMGFWDDRLMVSGCYYFYRSSNQLANSPMPAMTGLTNIVRNVPALIRNTGWEFEMRTQNIMTRKFSWSSVANISIPKNKLLSYPGSDLMVGESLSSYFVFHSAGVDPGNGAYLFKNAQGNKVSANENVPRSYRVNTVPDYYGSIQHTFRYKGWQLDMVLIYAKQTGFCDIYDGVYIPGMQRNQDKRAIARYWQQEGQVAGHQRMSAGGALRSGYLKMLESNMAYVNSSFLRCQTMTLSRKLPLRKLHLDDGNIYVQGQNLFTLTSYPGIDPETRSRTKLPLLRSLNVGIHVNI
jgi:TonB-linked SusC/RagA family outer membrane protein